MDPIVEKYASTAVPRYTSYPTVPHFRQDFAEASYRGFLANLDPLKPVSLYVHIPYCRQMCWYCGCNMKLVAKYQPVEDYVTTLLKELALVEAALPSPLRVDHIHFGGGTPTALEPNDMERIMTALRKAFIVSETAEIALESDPRTLTAKMAERVGALGFNRASFGIQEFTPRVQEAINRVQPPEMVQVAVDQLRAAGVRDLNFDLIYGLPHQTTEALLETVDICLTMAPDRFALFGYAHVPWMAKNQKQIREEDLPPPLERGRQASATSAKLAASGYQVIGLDHFALPSDPMAKAVAAGTLRRNFQGYTTDGCETLIGLGATSIGCTPSGFVQNIPETGAWARSVQAGRLPVNKGHTLTPEDKLFGAVINQLMCYGTTTLSTIAEAHAAPRDRFAGALYLLAPMIEDGLVTYDGDTLAVTDLGRPLVRVAAAAFDQYFQHAKARHSVAV